MSYEAKLLKLAAKLLVIGIIAAAVILWLVQWGLNRTPAQPIAFRHDIHAGQMGISCYYCHTGVLHGDQAGVPSVQDCMQCHQVINSAANPGVIVQGSDFDTEINKLIAYWNDGKGKSIYWHKVYKLPKHVHFPHKMHVNYFLAAAGKDADLGALEKSNPGVYPCILCHGNVPGMRKIKPAGKIFYKIWYGYNINPVTQMGYCINCHRSYAGKKLHGGPDVPAQEVMIDCTQCHR